MTKPKEDPNFSLSDDETEELKTVTGKLAGITIVKPPLSAFPISIALQGKLKILCQLDTTQEYFTRSQGDKLAELTSVALAFETIHIRLYFDVAYQNLDDKHSQVIYIVSIAHNNNDSILIHLHSSSCFRHPSSAEESELLALHLVLNKHRNFRHIIFQMLGNSVSTVCYIDNLTL